MTQDIAAAKTTMLNAPSLEVVTPLSSRTLFWRPRFLRESEALHHLPFLFWLIDVLRPKAFVTLGGDDGVMHFALCQAVEKLDLDARGYGVGPWPDGQLPSAMRAYNDDQYPDVSRLLPESASAAAGRIPQGSIDLLLVRMDGHMEEAELADVVERDWLQRLSARGVLLVHGATDAGREGGFLARMIAQHPSFRFDAGSGLVLIQYGNQPEDRLEKLCEIGLGDTGYAGILQVFSRLGGATRSEMTARQEGERAAKLSAMLDETLQNLQQARVIEAEQGADLSRVNAAYDERNRQVALVQARLIDLQATEATQQREIFDLSQQLERLTAQAQATQAHEAALAAELTRAQADLAARDAAIVDLEAQAAASRDMIAGLVADHARLSDVLAAKEADLTTLWANLEQLLQEQEGALARELALQTDLVSARDAHAVELNRLSAALSVLDAEASGARDLIASQAADQAALTEALAVKDAELATLWKNLEQLLQDQETVEVRERALQANAAAAEQRYADLNRQMRALSVERDAIADLLEDREAEVFRLTRLLQEQDGFAAKFAGQSTVDALQDPAREQEWAAERDALRADVLRLTTALESLQINTAAERDDLLEAQRILIAERDDLLATRLLEREPVDVPHPESAIQDAQTEARRQEILREIQDLADQRAELADSVARLAAEAEQQRQEPPPQNRAGIDLLEDREAAWAQERARYEEEIENARAMLHEYLTGSEVLPATDTAALTTLRAERDELAARVRATDAVITQLLHSSTWPPTAPERKLLEDAQRR